MWCVVGEYVFACVWCILCRESVLVRVWCVLSIVCVCVCVCV